MNWYKQSNIIGRDPFSVDFASEREKADGWDVETLIGALKDAIEASQISVNSGKYFDQASVYRQALENKGISIIKQDEMLQQQPSLHSTPQKPAIDPSQPPKKTQQEIEDDHWARVAEEEEENESRYY